MSETSSAIIITPGYLETSEETLTIEPFKKHPRDRVIMRKGNI